MLWKLAVEQRLQFPQFLPLADVKNESYSDVLERYNAYKADGLVEFTTFHQSYGYEEFIEGIKPVMDNTDDEQADIQYQIS